MQVKQLGNSGGLNPTATNSSFLVHFTLLDEYLLFDIGFNIMSKLIELDNDENENFKLSKLKYVYVSHTHDDHIGNLETLIFYQSFKNNICICVIGNEAINDYLMMKNINKIYNGFEVQNYKHYKYIPVDYARNLIKDTQIIFTPALHGACETNGLLLIQQMNNEKHTLFISGDTKATYKIEKAILDNGVDITSDHTMLFHDFSDWDAPSKNVHACKSDFSIEYSKEFQLKCIKYHNNKDFRDEWVKI